MKIWGQIKKLSKLYSLLLMKITEIFFYQNIRYFFGLILKITKHNCFVQSGFYLHILGLNIIVLDY